MTDRKRPDSCLGCPLYSMGTDFSQPEGTGRIPLLILAEASGEMEARDQLPLRPYAPAGSTFERTLRRIGMSREMFTTSNMLRCRPPGNKLDGSSYESRAVAHCQPNLVSIYLARKPKVILALGGIPFSYLAGEGGPGHSISTMRGYVFPVSPSYSAKMAEDAESRDVVILPTYHPSHIRRGAPELVGVFARDMLRAVRIAKGQDSSFLLGDPMIAFSRGDGMDFELSPDLEDGWSFFRMCQANPNLPIAYDIETYETASLDEDARDQFEDTNVRSVQFSAAHNQAIVFAWNKEFREIAAAIMKLQNPKFSHNGRKFDNRVLAAVGERLGTPSAFLPAGRLFDTLDMWRRWQPELPGNLQYVASFVQYPFPWKHLNQSQPKFYAAVDADAGRRIGMMLVASMKDAGILEKYEIQVAAIHDVPAKVAAHGVTVSRSEARKGIKEIVRLQGEVIREMDSLYPESIRSFSPDSGYKRVPKDVDARIRLWASEERGVLLGERTVRDGESESEYVTRMTGLVEREFTVKEKNPVTTLSEMVTVRRWCRKNDLSANSRPQILAYAALRKHEVPKEERENGRKSESLTLESIEYLFAKTGDKYYAHVSRWRRLDEEKKIILDLIRDGSGDQGDEVTVHSYFAIDREGGISGRNPTFPQLGTFGMGSVTARAGRKLVLLLVDSLPEMIIGERSGDKGWQARVGEGPGWRAKLEKEGGIPVNVTEGIVFGLSDMGILDANRMTLGTKLKSVGEWRRKFTSMFPDVIKWHARVMKAAHESPQMLINRFGELGRFYEVYVPDKKGEWKPGGQAAGAIQFFPKSESAGWMNEVVRRVSGMPIFRDLAIMSRDLLMFEVDEEGLDEEQIRKVAEVMGSGWGMGVVPRVRRFDGLGMKSMREVREKCNWCGLDHWGGPENCKS